MPTGLQHDERGRPFFFLGDDPTQKRSYVSPMAMGQPAGELGQGGSFFRHPGEWNNDTGEVEHPFNWGNTLSLAVGGGLGASAFSAIPAFGGGAGGFGAATVPEVAGPAAAGGGMSPAVTAALLQMAGNIGSAAFAPGQQERQSYTGDVSAQNTLQQSQDFKKMLSDVLMNQGPIDLSGRNAPMPEDPAGRVPRRRALPGMEGGQPQAAPSLGITGGPNQRRDGALQLLRSLGVAA